MKRAASPAPTDQTTSSSASSLNKKQKHVIDDDGIAAELMELGNAICDKFKPYDPNTGIPAGTGIITAYKEILKVAFPSDLPSHTCKITPKPDSNSAGYDFPDQEYPRQDIVKTIYSEIYTKEMIENADCYVCEYGRWDYSHSPTSSEINPQASDVIQVAFRATIAGGERTLNHLKSAPASHKFEGILGVPSCANDSTRHIIVPIPDGEDYTWFSSEAGKNEVYKALNEVYVWINTTKICTTQINTPAVYLHIISRYGGHYESMHRWQTESMREYELKRDQAMQAQIEPPFVMYCGRPAISGQSICGKCSLTQSMLSSGF